MANDLSVFLKQLILRPREISAAIPSSRRLARMMADAVPDITGSIAELGPGTGRMTQALLDKGARPQNLSLFEINAVFARHLTIKFPEVSVHNQSAQDMTAAGLNNLSAVVSGLPFLSIPLPIQREIIRASFDVLAPNGVYIQFTYGRKLPIHPEIIEQHSLSAKRFGLVWGNLPPAQVLVFSR
ncbi:MAG: methyltransferase type 12 [Marinosulfonomonas sp.]|nr:MAG: methyltransferase type 12 [Marinosulfonomonas sp.]